MYRPLKLVNNSSQLTEKRILKENNAQSIKNILLQAIQNNQVSVSILQKRLKEVHASLVRAAEKLGASEAVAAFEEEYGD